MAVARFIGADEVVKKYNETGAPCFSMWCKSQLICQYTGDDIGEGETIIREEIERNVKRGFGAECYLKIHPDPEKAYTIKSVVVYNIVFKSFDDSQNMLLAGAGGNQMSFAIMQNLNALSSRVAALEPKQHDPDDEDDEDDEDDQDDKIGAIVTRVESLISHPVIGKLIDRFFPVGNNNPTAIAGAPGEDLHDQQLRLQKAISILVNKGVTVEHFEKLAAMPAIKIKGLLTML